METDNLVQSPKKDLAGTMPFDVEPPAAASNVELLRPETRRRPGSDRSPRADGSAEARALRGTSTIEYERNDSLPKLAWIATVDVRNHGLQVTHGRGVECRPQWMVEGVWDGRFEDGDFHRGAHLFGSGIRLEGDAMYFMPSCALVDRLFYCRNGEELLVSNSLLVLLAVTGAELDPQHDYLTEGKAVSVGIDEYDTSFHVLHPSIPSFHQVFHKAIVVRAGGVAFERTIGVRPFDDFADYYGTLRERLAALCENAVDPRRKTPVDLYGTLSNGYDSTAVTTIVRELGVDEFFTYVGSWAAKSAGKAEHETAPIAAALGVKTVPLRAPREPDIEDELLLRAAIPLAVQVPLLTMARYVEGHSETAAVFTGFHGDIIWDMNVPDEFVSEAIVRHDMSGLDLSELRLKSGFYNVAVPFFYAASIESIVAISRSGEMEPWRVNKRYDRPISRRIVETAGVPREAFGFLKAGIFTVSIRPTHPVLREKFFDYVHKNIVPLPLLYLRIGCDRYTLRLLEKGTKFAKSKLNALKLEAALLRCYRWIHDGYSWCGGRLNLRNALHTWAVAEALQDLRGRGIGRRGAEARAAQPAVTAG
jgi:hypothetical protein